MWRVSLTVCAALGIVNARAATFVITDGRPLSGTFTAFGDRHFGWHSHTLPPPPRDSEWGSAQIRSLAGGPGSTTIGSFDPIGQGISSILGLTPTGDQAAMTGDY